MNMGNQYSINRFELELELNKYYPGFSFMGANKQLKIKQIDLIESSCNKRMVGEYKNAYIILTENCGVILYYKKNFIRFIALNIFFQKDLIHFEDGIHHKRVFNISSSRWC